jgi:VCBS repeat-containing protein
MEATAAGGIAAAGGGITVYKVDATGKEVTPEAFAETGDYDEGQVDTLPGANEPPAEPEPEPEPAPEPPPPANSPPEVVVNADGIGDTVYEAGLPTGSDAASDSESAAGSFTISDSDGLDDIDSVTIAGITFNSGTDFTDLGDLVGQTFDVGYGTVELTSYSGGTFGYTYTLDETVDNDSQAGATDAGYDESFDVTVSDGEASATATVTVGIADDEPRAVDDSNSITEDDESPVTGDVMPNDVHVNGQVGADGVNFVTWDGSLTGSYGTLTDNGGGNYSYTLHNNNPAVQELDTNDPPLTDTFDYTIVDADGDEKTATLTIYINGENDAPVAVPDTNWAQEDVSDASGNVLQTIPHPDQPSGGPFSDVADTDVDVEPLTVSSVNGDPGKVGVQFTGVYGDLKLNSNGSYDYFLNDAHPDVQALDDGQTLTDTFSYTANDGTVDSNSANLTITIFGSNDAPTIGVETEPHQVYEAGLDAGGSRAASADEFASGSFTVADTDGLDDINSITIHNTTFVIGDGPGEFASLSLLVGETVDVGYGTIELTSYLDGTFDYTYTLDDPVDNDDPAAVAAGADDAGYDESFDVTVDDGDETDTGTITVHIVDDEPVIIAPDQAHVLDGSSAGELINFVAGADGVDTVEFNVDSLIGQVATDTEGRPLSLNGETLFLHYGDDGADKTVLVGKTADGDIGFTVDISDDGTTYSISTNSIISNGTEVIPTTLQGVGGGNYAWDALVDVGGTDQDVLITTADTTTVNTNANSFGVSSGQSMVDGEGLRLDFVNGLVVTGSGTNKSYTYDTTNGGHNLTNHYTQEIYQVVGTTANLTVTAILADNEYDFYDDPPGDSDGEETVRNLDPNDITVYDDLGNEVTPGGGSGLSITDAGNSVLIEGLQQDWQFVIDSDDQFSAVQIDAASGTDPFKLGLFTYGEASPGDPIDLSYEVVGTDGDGDTTDGFLDATIYAEVDESGDGEDNVLLGTDGPDDLDGYAGDDILAGGQGDDDLDGGDDADALFGGSGDDTLVGGAGEDLLVGGSGDDTLTGGDDADTFEPGVGNDTITDYDKGEGDLVDISDLFDEGAGDYLAVSENADGSARLTVFSGNDAEKGSVSFADIDYDVDLTPGDELNSLLGQVDVDDGTT